MFGVSIISICFLVVAFFIFLGLGAYQFSQSMLPHFPIDLFSVKMISEANDRALKAQIFWGIVAVILCIAAVILA